MEPAPAANRQHTEPESPHRRAMPDGIAAPEGHAPTPDPFLTPRVVDRMTFEEYGRLLREAITRAASESELLARRAEAAAVVLDQLESFIGTNADAIERAAEILTSIDERTGATRDLLGEIDRRAAGLGKAAAAAEAAVETRSEQFENRLRAIVDAAMDRFEETEDQLSARAAATRRTLIERIEEIRSKGDAAVARIEQRVQASTAVADEDAARLQSTLETVKADAEARTARLASAVAQIDAQADESALLLQERAASVKRDIEDLAAQTVARLAADTDRAERAAVEADDRTATLEQLLAHAEDQAARAAETMLAASRTMADHKTTTIAAFADEIETDVEGRLDEVRGRIAEALEDRISAAASQQDLLNQARVQAERLINSAKLRSTLSRCAGAEDSAATALMRFEQLRDQCGVAATTLGDTILTATARIDDLDARSEDLVERSLRQLADVAPTLDRAAVLAERLEPWVELLEPASPGRMPEPVAQIIDEVRRELASDGKAAASDETTRIEMQAMSEALLALTEKVAGLEAQVAATSADNARPAATTTVGTNPAASTPANRKPASPDKAASHKAARKKAASKKTGTKKTGTKATRNTKASTKKAATTKAATTRATKPAKPAEPAASDVEPKPATRAVARSVSSDPQASANATGNQ